MKRRGKAKIKHIVSDEELANIMNEKISNMFIKLSKSDIKDYIRQCIENQNITEYDNTIQN